MHSSHDMTHSTYKVNLKTNVTELVEFPGGMKLDEAPVAPDDINNQTVNDQFDDEIKRELSKRFVPSHGFR